MGPVEDFPPTRLLESLPARPPTPPRDTISHDTDALPKQLTVDLRHLQTPPGFPSPSCSSQDSTARRKRVGFSSQPQYQEPPIYIDPVSLKKLRTPVSRPSSTPRPVKGILKPATAPNRLGPAVGQELEDLTKPGQADFADMLESTLQQLAGAERESRIDAYTMLFRGLKASSNLPDRIALQQKMGLFLQFIQRDLSAKSPSGSVDILIITSAIKLLHTFLRHQGIASSIPSEFGIFLVDHCVRSFQEEQSPKEIVRHLMHSLCLQTFFPDVMTTERVGRLVNALHDVENYLTGKSIIQSRIYVYEKLVSQCPHQMTIHSDWMQDLMTDMLSSAIEIRSAAIRLGFNAAFTLNTEKRLLSKAAELLNLSLEEQKYVEHISGRLKSMLQNADDSVFVPRIWSVITLFIFRPGQWEYFTPWANILLSCFNHATVAVRKEANLAWCRFTYRLYIDGGLGTKKAIALIRDPLKSQLRGKRKALREYVLGSVRNFLYYACRPEMDLKTMSDVWDLGIAPLIHRLIEHAQEENNSNIAEATTLLTGLVECETRRVWKANRIADSTLIKDAELPAIDPRWIRTNSARVFELAGPLLKKQFAEIALPASQSHKLWQALVGSVASASAKDVILHEDTAKFVAEAFTFLLAVWNDGPSTAMDGKPCTPSHFLDSVRDFILILVQGLGLLPNPFSDKHFVRSKDDKFTLYTASSSHRSAKHQLTKRTPLHHLFLMLSHLPSGLHDDVGLVKFFEFTFSPFFDEKSQKAQADLARELLRLLPLDAYCPSGTWVLCATKISASVGDSQDSAGSGGNLGPRFRDVVKMLERGLRSSPNLPWEHWCQPFHELVSCVENETGVAGVAIAVVEPLAAVLKDLTLFEEAAVSTTCVRATIELLTASTHPRDKSAVDASRRRLWGTSVMGARQASFDPYDNLYKLLVCMLTKAYANMASCDSAHVIQLLAESRGFFERGNSKLLLPALISTQESVAQWVEDKDHRVTRTDSPEVAKTVESLWQTFCKILVQASAAKLQLQTVEPLFCAAFRSTHREIVRAAVETWNHIYEHVDHIEYPETLKNVLESLGSSVDVIRPGLDIQDDSNMRPDFTESQDCGNELPFISPEKFQPTPLSRPSASRRSATPGSAKTTERRSIRAESTSSVRRKSKGRTPKTKLRHEDSQMHFAAIESSPAPSAQESQLLTDRQKEIRERQRETAAMFPALRSSPTEKTKKAQSADAQQPIPSVTCRASTPENDVAFDSCLTSTPTPRRGRSAPLPEQDIDMTDPPSSPPEPRGFRLLAELKSQASKSIQMDDWHFSSSPISGSPNPAVQTNSVAQAMQLEDVDEQLQLDGNVDGAVTNDCAEVVQHDVPSSQPKIVVEHAMCTQVNDTELPTPEGADAKQSSQTTPSGRNLQSGEAQLTPKSDNEEFMDARSSPMPPTPSQRFATAGSPVAAAPLNAANESFNVSASFGNGLRNIGTARIEIPLRSSQATSPSRQEYRAYKDILPESPENIEAQLTLQDSKRQDGVEVLDTIEVAGVTAKNKKRGRGRPKTASASASQASGPSHALSVNTQDSQGSQAQVPSTPVQEIESSQGKFDNVSPGIGKWWRKRKRSISSSVFSSGGSKKARHEDFLAAESVHEEIPDSQPNPDAAAVQEDPTVEMPIVEEVHHDEVASVSNESDFFAEHTMSSQELPSAGDEEPAEELDEETAEPQREPESELEAEAEAEVATNVEPMVDAPKDHTDYMDEDMDYTDDEEAVHSQLAREEEESASRPASPARAILEHAVLAQEGMAPLDDEEEQDAAPQKEVTTTEQAPLAPVDKFHDLMDTLGSGLDILRTVEMTREQFYKVEDLMFEMRTQLLEAQRRGRK